MTNYYLSCSIPDVYAVPKMSENLQATKVDNRNVQLASTQQRVFLETAFRFSPKHPCTLNWRVADCPNRARNTVQTILLQIAKT